MFLINPFRGWKDVDAPEQRRIRTLSALHRLLSEEFERRRPCECSCQFPVVFKREPLHPDDCNWQVETLWCGCPGCQKTLHAVVASHARLFQVKDAPEAGDE